VEGKSERPRAWGTPKKEGVPPPHGAGVIGIAPGPHVAPRPQPRSGGRRGTPRGRCAEHVPMGVVWQAKPAQRADTVGVRCSGTDRLAGLARARRVHAARRRWAALVRPRRGYVRAAQPGQHSGPWAGCLAWAAGALAVPCRGGRAHTGGAVGHPPRASASCVGLRWLRGRPSKALAPAHPAGRRARLRPRGSPKTKNSSPARREGSVAARRAPSVKAEPCAALRVLAGSQP